jgi:hypothetical protein
MVHYSEQACVIILQKGVMVCYSLECHGPFLQNADAAPPGGLRCTVYFVISLFIIVQLCHETVYAM